MNCSLGSWSSLSCLYLSGETIIVPSSRSMERFSRRLLMEGRTLEGAECKEERCKTPPSKAACSAGVFTNDVSPLSFSTRCCLKFDGSVDDVTCDELVSGERSEPQRRERYC